MTDHMVLQRALQDAKQCADRVDRLLCALHDLGVVELWRATVGEEAHATGNFDLAQNKHVVAVSHPVEDVVHIHQADALHYFQWARAQDESLAEKVVLDLWNHIRRKWTSCDPHPTLEWVRLPFIQRRGDYGIIRDQEGAIEDVIKYSENNIS